MMKRALSLTLSSLLLLTLATSCGGTSNKSNDLTPEQRTESYVKAITAARDAESNQYDTLLTSASDDNASMVFETLGVTAEDMTAFALSVSMMNVRAYAVAAVYPAAGKDETVRKGLEGFIERQKQNFYQYLEAEYAIAGNARLETLEDGTILLVMAENQDALFDAIRDGIEGK